MTNETPVVAPAHAPSDSLSANARNEAKQHLPGEASIWLFVIGDMVIFSCYFAAYLYDRARDHATFLQAQQHLSQNMGVVNTLTLLTSSLFVALSIQAARAGEFVVASRFLAFGGSCGAGFILIKAYEWYLELSAGYAITSGAFFMHYYMITGLHFFHVLLGLIILTMLRIELRRRIPRVQVLEVGATYWHMVDFLWILIFALVYLMR